MTPHDAPLLLQLPRGAQRLLQLPAGSLLQVHSGRLLLCQALSGLLPGLSLADSLWQARCELLPGQVWQAPETLWLRLDTPGQDCLLCLLPAEIPAGLWARARAWLGAWLKSPDLA
ncbi:hypothetical protein HNP55_004560 [Paucibacter oligotrophus]|uniref:Uncharacterized protein n=1 Tax=Roseateles oligotrophus TaxID=1769250 RepID=A0A840LCW5_9BURK|nr:hypothetical protein [Roseateles oligotrophus]MBB4846006.1 hypothetical protein [Roseateles oligotrophus]